MKKYFFLWVVALTLAVAGCKSGSSETSEDTQDTVIAVAPPPPPAEPVMDDEAITKRYSQRQSAGTHEAKPQKVDDKTVVYDSEPFILHHDADESSDPGLTDPEGYYFNASNWAHFPGGEAALDDYLEKNLKYPKPARDEGIQGTVYASLRVDEAGRITDVSFPGKHLGFGLEEEVARVVKLMPQWEPGEYNASKVKSKFILPVKFKLQ